MKVKKVKNRRTRSRSKTRKTRKSSPKRRTLLYEERLRRQTRNRMEQQDLELDRLLRELELEIERKESREKQEEPKREIPPHFLQTFLLQKEEDRECCVCLQTMSKNVYMTPCYHFFHTDCINSIKTCPVCTKEL